MCRTALAGTCACLIYQALGFSAWTTLIPVSNYSVLVAGLPAAHKTRLLPCGSVLMSFSLGKGGRLGWCSVMADRYTKTQGDSAEESKYRQH